MQKKNQLIEILFNLLIPIIILTKFSGEQHLGPKLALIIALSFPLIYGLIDYLKRKKLNFFSILGLISILATGFIGIFELPNNLLAVKEASIPLIIGISILILQFFGRSTVYELLKNTLNFEKIFSIAKEKNSLVKIKNNLKISNYFLAAIFLVSALINYLLTKLIVISPPGTLDYNIELGKLTGISFIIILIPFILAFILITGYLIHKIKKHTGLNLDKILS